MHINCPHCHNSVEVVAEASLTDVDCPSCGSRFSLLGDDPNKTVNFGHEELTIGRFELLNEVGVGAFGSVWRCNDPQLDRTVAIKIPRKGQLTQSESEQFFREARAAAQLKHPNIVPVHEIGRDDDRIYIVSDFVQGVSLADRLTAGPFGMRDSIELCIKVCRALDHAHDQGVIHRDLKPANIMLDDEGQPHVMDFGLAKREAGEITMTMDGQLLGTPAYMSPEQASGSAHSADGRADTYSVGVILFEMLTGELPFRGNTRMLIHQVINEEAPSPLKLNSNIDKDVATIILKCLQKEPDKRYASADLLADDLQNYLNGQPITARPVGNVERCWRWCKRNRSLAAAIGLSVSLLTTFAIGGPLVAINRSALTEKANKAAKQALLQKQRAKDEAIKAREAELEANASAKRSSDVLKIVTKAFNPSREPIAGMTAKDVLSYAQTEMNNSELDPLAQAELSLALATSFVGVGEYDSAIASAKRSVDLWSNESGLDEPKTLTAMHYLAVAHFRQGDFQEALRLDKETIKLRTKVLGPEHKDTLTSMTNLANDYSRLGRTDEALELNEKILDTRKRTLGPEHLDTLRSMNNLALNYKQKKRFAEALELERSAFEIQSKRLGRDHPDTLITMQNLASSYGYNGKPTEAMKMQEETVKLRSEALGPKHPQTLRSQINLAAKYFQNGRAEKAVSQIEETLVTMRKELGANHPDCIRSIKLAKQIANRLERQLQKEESERLKSIIAEFEAISD